MKYRKQTSTGDYVFGNNKNDYVAGNLAVAYAIKSKILLFYGEWWEDIGIGIPMFQSIIGQGRSEALKNSAQMLISERIKEIDPYDIEELKKSHGIMTKYVVDISGEFRNSDEGVFDDRGRCFFIAPPPYLVPSLMDDLFNWMQDE